MDIAGVWYNELGSKMTIQSVDGATISGTYESEVGDAKYTYPLIGQIDLNPRPGADSQAMGWTVVWNNQANGSSFSVTTWSGQYQMYSPGGNSEVLEEEIVTFWLLTTEMPEQNDWAATQIGQDTFKRNAPSGEDVDRAKRRRRTSSPRQR